MTFVDDLFILGDAKVLFTNFINWLIRDCMRGFTLLAHNGAGFDSHYLFRYIRSDFGFYVEPLYQGSRLLQFLVKETRERVATTCFVESTQFNSFKRRSNRCQNSLVSMDST